MWSLWSVFPHGSFNGSNMNGEYLMQRTPRQGAGNWSTNFSEYPGGVEYFEVYVGPVTSTYVLLSSSVRPVRPPSVRLIRPAALALRVELAAVARRTGRVTTAYPLPT
jgi:hypothetical protein